MTSEESQGQLQLIVGVSPQLAQGKGAGEGLRVPAQGTVCVCVCVCVCGGGDTCISVGRGHMKGMYMHNVHNFYIWFSVFSVLRTTSCTCRQSGDYHYPLLRLPAHQTHSHLLFWPSSISLSLHRFVRIVNQSRDLSQYFKMLMLTSCIPTMNMQRTTKGSNSALPRGAPMRQ